MNPLITNGAIVLGILMAILGAVFVTAHSNVPLWKKFYTYILCIVTVTMGLSPAVRL
jgi:hypothetical protein